MRKKTILAAAMATAMLSNMSGADEATVQPGQTAAQTAAPGAAQQAQNAAAAGSPAPDEASDKELTPAQKERAANKASVLRQLENLFKNSAKPFVSQKPAVPQKPYISVVEGKNDRVTILYRCRFVKSKTIVDAMESVVSSSGTVEDSPDQNIILVNDVKENADEIKQALISFDIPLPQILVEAQVIEVVQEQDTQKDVKVKYTHYDATRKQTTTYGYDLTSPTTNSALDNSSSGTSFYPYSSGSADGNFTQFNMAANLLSYSRDAKVLSSPNMIVDLGTTASMITGEDVPIQTTAITSGTVTTSTYYKRIGVKLNVTPTLINKDIVQLEVNPEVSSISSYQTFTQNSVTTKTPVIAIRNVKTRLSAADGQVIMLGGLYSSEKIIEENKVPFFGEIPVLGEAFNSKYQTDVDKQLIFFLKIHILHSAESVLLDPEDRAREIRHIGNIVRNSDGIFEDKIKHALPDRSFEDKAEEMFDGIPNSLDDERASGGSSDK